LILKSVFSVASRQPIDSQACGFGSTQPDSQMIEKSDVLASNNLFVSNLVKKYKSIFLAIRKRRYQHL